MKLLAILTSVLVVAGCQSREAGSGSPANEFHFNNGAEPEGLDPHKTSSHDAAQLNINMFEGLVGREADFFTIRPGLAESWTVSNDGLTYTFKLRPGIKWSNGDAITAEQFRQSFIRALDPKVASPYVNWHTDFIAGAADVAKNFDKADARAAAEKTYGVTAPDASTVIIKLKKPVPYFISLLTQPVFVPVHPSMFDANSAAWRNPAEFITSGAYKLGEWKVNERVVLVKNPNYRNAANVKIEKVVSYPISEENTTLNMYRSGQLDWTGENHISSTLVPSLKARDDFKFTETFGTYMYVFNVKRPPLDNPKVRRALALALNTPEITDKVVRSGVTPAYSLVPKGIPTYQSTAALPKEMDARLAEAKKLLAEAGFPDGKGFPKLTILYNTTEGHHKIAQAVQQMWKQNLGLDIQLQNQEWKVFLKEQQAGNFDISRWGWIGDYPDPNTFLETFVTGNENNQGKFSNARFDELVKASISEKDAGKRMKMLADAEAIVIQENPMAPIYHYVYYSLMSPRVEGFKPNMFGHYYFEYLSKK